MNGDYGAGGFVNQAYTGLSGSNKEVKKYSDEMEKLRTYCPNCHHTLTLIHGVDKNLCDHCGRYVYKNKEIERVYKQKEFKIIMQRKMKEIKNEK